MEGVEERRRGNCVERVMCATARRFVVSPAALGVLGLGERDAQDAYSSNYAIAVAAQTIRDVSTLREQARAAEKQMPTLTMQLDVRFATPAARAAFAEEVMSFLAAATRKYHAPDAIRGPDLSIQHHELPSAGSICRTAQTRSEITTADPKPTERVLDVSREVPRRPVRSGKR